MRDFEQRNRARLKAIQWLDLAFEFFGPRSLQIIMIAGVALLTAKLDLAFASSTSKAADGASSTASPSTPFELPLIESAWTSLSFKKLRANEVHFDDQGLQVKVRSSASPLIHALREPLEVAGIQVTGRWREIQMGKPVSSDFDEDSILRVGLVVPGRQTLSGPKRWLAADWVKRLFELAPKGSGIDRIEFLMFTTNQERIGRERAHPKSDLIRERLMSLRPTAGDFEVSWRLPDPLKVAAIWLSIDGDDTGSSFEMSIQQLTMVSPSQ